MVWYANINWITWICISSIVGAITLIVKKKALTHEHATEFLTTFKFFEILTLVFFIPFMNFNIPTGLFFLTFLFGLLSAIYLNLIAKSYRHMDLSIVSPLTNIQPAFVILIAFTFLRERLTNYQFGGIILLIIGAYLLEASDHNLNFLNNIKRLFSKKYVKILLIALVLASMVDVGHKYLVSSVDPVTLLFLSYVFTFIGSFVISTIFYDGYKDLIHGIKNAGKIISFQSVLSTISNITYYFALTQTMVSLTIPVKKLSTLIAVIVGGKIFHEKNLFHRSLACVIMMIGATLILL